MNSWVEIEGAALRSNVARFRELIGPDRLLAAVVKANAYGHGAEQVAPLAIEAGADWLGVFSIDEALALRGAGIRAPVLVMGPPETARIREACDAGVRLTVPSLAAAEEIARRAGETRPVRVHLKVETGTNRQGLCDEELARAAALLAERRIDVEGAYTHFADIEDTTDHQFAEQQLARFVQQREALRAAGVETPIPHTACSAATILFPDTYFRMVRVGISLYGLWPSRETLVSARSLGRDAVEFKPVMTWKTRIAQVKSLPTGEYVSYGRTFRTTRPSRIAVLPVGYADGYDRRLSGAAHVLVRGVRAPVRGRVCMNLSLIDVTDIPGAEAGDEAVLLGRQGDEVVSAEDLARLAGTINYEIVTRIAPAAPRIVV